VRITVFFTYLKRELRRRRRQAMVVALGLAVGIGLVITVSAASAGVTTAQSQVLESLYGVGTDITVTQPSTPGTGGPGRFDFGSGDTSSTTVTQDRLMVGGGVTTLDASAIATVSSQPHVSSAAGSLALNDVTVSGNFTPPTNAGGTTGGTTGQPPTQGGGGQQGGGTRPQIDINSFSITGIDVSAADIGPLSSATLADGRGFTTADATSAVALISGEYANDKSLKVGDTLTVAGTPLSIVGVVSTPSGDTTNVFIPLKEAQTLANLADKVTTIYVRATSANDVTAAQTEIQSAVSGATVKTSSDLAAQISGSLSSAASLAKNLGTWLSIAVLLAAFVMAVLFTISGVSRRIREFGTLKALGWRSRRVIGQVVGESLVQGLVGGVVGIGLGFLGAFLVSTFAPTLSATVATATGAGRGGGQGAGGFAGGPGGGEGGGGFGGAGAAARTAANAVAVHLTAPITLTAIALAVGLAIAGGLIAGAFGGWRAARMRPADALRRLE
jgi:ABC-type antimicrobial peptide transport system permease subunit